MPEKIFVAVHGIGEQLRGETIRSVANQVCRFCGVPASIPLGRFGAELIPVPGPATGTIQMNTANPSLGDWRANPETPPTANFLVAPPQDPNLPGVVFGEVYWADFARGPAAHRYTLDEAKKWAQSVVERVRAQDEAANRSYSRRFHYGFATNVIGEMIEGIRVLESLLWLADRAGVFRFDLKKLLVDYLGDVQVVTEFRNYRRAILDTVHRTLERAHKDYPEGEIFLVAHSEGTVITFLALLEALCGFQSGPAPGPSPLRIDFGRGAGPQPVTWHEAVRGLMTIGSPIGKHLLLWPWLWDQLPGAGRPARAAIPWRNYYDYGDPVGYNLEQARNWLEAHGWTGAFDFGRCDKGDIGFTRYMFPGAAHTGYWSDEKVFDHFLGNVVWPAGPPAAGAAPAAPAPAAPPAEAEAPKPPQPAAGAPAAPRPRPGPPRTKPIEWVVSRLLPYVLALGVLLLGVYLLIKGSLDAHGSEESVGNLAWDVLGLGALLAGVTVAVRIPRLTLHPLWVFGALLVAVAGLAAFPVVISDDLRDWLWLILSRHQGGGLEPVLNVGATRTFALLLAFAGGYLVAYAVSLVAGRQLVTRLVFLASVAVLAPVCFLSVPPEWFGSYVGRVPPTLSLVLLLAVAVGFLAYLGGMFWPVWGVKLIVFAGAVVVLTLTWGDLLQTVTFAEYTMVREEAARWMGLQGPELDDAATDIFRKLAEQKDLPDNKEDLDKNHKEFRKKARKVAISLRADEKYVKEVQPPLQDLLRDEAAALPAACCEAKPRVWPFLLAGAAFLYLWWLAALLLDLAVVWHHFIKGEAIVYRLEETQLPPQEVRTPPGPATA